MATGSGSYKGSGCSAPILATDHAVPAAASGETEEQRAKRKENAQRPKEPGKKARIGDTVTWRPFNVPASEERGGTMECPGGQKVIEVHDKWVIVSSRRKKRKIPRCHIDWRQPAEGDESEAKERGARAKTRKTRQRRASLSSPAAAASPPATAVAETSEDGFHDDGNETSELFTENEKRLVRQELQAVQSALRSFKSRAGARAAKHGDTIASLEESLREARAQLDELRSKHHEKPLGKPLHGETVPIKVNGVVPDNIRDLAVDLGVQQGYPGGTVFDAVALMLEKMGASVTNQVQDPSNMFAQCLVERALMLEEDQAMRMAEARRTGAALTIREKEWTESELELAEAAEKLTEEMYEREILKEIEPWLNWEKHNESKYDSKRVMGKLTDIDVGEEATDEEIRSGAEKGKFGCAFMYMAVDGTAHGR